MIQKEIEKAGIPTMSLTHFPDLSAEVHVPRALHIKFPLGRTFGEAGRSDLQEKIVVDMLQSSQDKECINQIKQLKYRWKRD
ncbi:hypothetical protein ACM26V_10230 [Salipaludibacillus sp. HK11]|uniref:hypothetical protein n=1 Tax=Salipaludibacillus sp. HK11 TaxID=3394320 RepID=UPI0039FD88A7